MVPTCKLPNWPLAAAKVSEELDRIVDEDLVFYTSFLEKFGAGEEEDIDDARANAAASRIARALNIISTDILEHVRAAAGDPETEVPKWLQSTAPMGIVHPIRATGVFPILTQRER